MIFLDYNQISSGDNKSEEEIEYENLMRECRSTAIYYLLGRHRSSGQLRKKLQENENNFPKEMIEDVIAAMENEAYLKDQELADYVLRSRRGSKAESKLALYHRMQNFGIREDIINLNLDSHIDDYTLLCEFISKKKLDLVDELKRAEDYDERNNLLAKLLRSCKSRGFSEHLVFKYINS